MGRMHCPDSASTDKKITEAYFQKVLISSVLGILLCMVCLVSTTWALFSTEIVSENNAITMGSFTATTIVEPNAPATFSGDVSTFPLAGPGSYMFTIKPADGSTKGYCKISALYEDGTTAHLFVTETLSLAENQVNSVMFTVTLNDESPVSIVITSFWGESSAEPLGENSTFTFGEAAADDTQSNEETETGTDEEQTDDPEGESDLEPEDTDPPADTPSTESDNTDQPDDAGDDVGDGTVTESTETTEPAEEPAA